MNYLPGLAQTVILLISTSQVARITGMGHCTQLVNKILKKKN
jgi:hypothetical protein